MSEYKWTKGIAEWREGRTRFLSVPFTWLMPAARHRAQQQDMFCDITRVGGPAVKNMPDYIEPTDTILIGGDVPALHRHHGNASRTSLGCPNKCSFCAVPKIEPNFIEIEDFDVKPILCDNNFLACSETHRERVYAALFDAGLAGQVDFNQGLEARLMTDWDAMWLSKLKASVRFACDSHTEIQQVRDAYAMVRKAKVAKNRISCYALVGYRTDPAEAWTRCNEIDKGIGITYTSPMWHHALDQLRYGIVREDQMELGWSKQEKCDIMGFFWKHRGERKHDRTLTKGE
jgi:hypothetical protein